MSEDIIGEAEVQVATMVRLAVQVAEAKRWRDQRALAASNDAARAEEARARATLDVARPYLAEGMRDRWWQEARLEDAMHMLGVSQRFRDRDPMAQQVYARAMREISERWKDEVEMAGLSAEAASVEEVVDVVGTASDAQIAEAEPLVAGEPATPAAELRESAVERQAEAEGVSETIEAIEANTSLPDHIKAGLVARLQPGATPRVSGTADVELADAQAARDRAAVDILEFDGRVRAGDETAESELARAEAAHATAEADLVQARGQAMTGDREVDAGLQARDDSFPVPAEQAVNASASQRPRRATEARKARQARRRAGRSMT